MGTCRSVSCGSDGSERGPVFSEGLCFIEGREFICVTKQVLAFVDGQLITS